MTQVKLEVPTVLTVNPDLPSGDGLTCGCELRCSVSDTQTLSWKVDSTLDLGKWHRVVACMGYSSSQDTVIFVGGSTPKGKRAGGQTRRHHDISIGKWVVYVHG